MSGVQLFTVAANLSTCLINWLQMIEVIYTSFLKDANHNFLHSILKQLFDFVNCESPKTRVWHSSL